MFGEDKKIKVLTEQLGSVGVLVAEKQNRITELERTLHDTLTKLEDANEKVRDLEQEASLNTYRPLEIKVTVEHVSKRKK